jgi:hypothetical protein
VEGDVGCLPTGTKGIDMRDSIFRAEVVVAGLRGIGMLDDRLGLVLICSVGAKAHQEQNPATTRVGVVSDVQGRFSVTC